eukprot:scaffold40033_cov37-Tisochrysis_lutea.AAC.2
MSASRSTTGGCPSCSGSRSSGCARITWKSRMARRRACESVLAEEMSEPRSSGPARALSLLSRVCAFSPARGGSFGRDGGSIPLVSVLAGALASIACRAPNMGAGKGEEDGRVGGARVTIGEGFEWLRQGWECPCVQMPGKEILKWRHVVRIPIANGWRGHDVQHLLGLCRMGKRSASSSLALHQACSIGPLGEG